MHSIVEGGIKFHIISRANADTWCRVPYNSSRISPLVIGTVNPVIRSKQIDILISSKIMAHKRLPRRITVDCNVGPATQATLNRYPPRNRYLLHSVTINSVKHHFYRIGTAIKPGLKIVRISTRIRMRPSAASLWYRSVRFAVSRFLSYNRSLTACRRILRHWYGSIRPHFHELGYNCVQTRQANAVPRPDWSLLNLCRLRFLRLLCPSDGQNRSGTKEHKPRPLCLSSPFYIPEANPSPIGLQRVCLWYPGWRPQDKRFTIVGKKHSQCRLCGLGAVLPDKIPTVAKATRQER